MPRIPVGTRRAPLSWWLLEFDTLGRVYSGQRDWRDEALATAKRRDSVARALDAHGARHVLCRDSVDRQTAGHPRWVSLWRGRTYNAVLFHWPDRDTLTLSLQVSPGMFGVCPNFAERAR